MGRLDGVRNIPSTLFRFPGAFEGVCGPDLPEIMSRILLYSLYFCAELGKLGKDFQAGSNDSDGKVSQAA